MQKWMIGSAILALIIVLAIAFIVRRPTEVVLVEDAPIAVATSFYPLAYFTKDIGGDLVSVTNITPTGIEPHEFEPTPGNVAAMYEADLVLYNGGIIDAWADRLAADLESSGVMVVKMSSVMNDLLINQKDETFDPHFWLSPIRSQVIAATIADALVQIDPRHADTYLNNARTLIDELSLLDQEFARRLADCEKPVIITSHSAMGYLADEYGFAELSITGLSPEEEPSLQTLSDLATLAREYDIKTIYFEELVSPELAETLANEIGASVQVFYPIEGLTSEQVQANEDYLSLMIKNLDALVEAMQCSNAN